MYPKKRNLISWYRWKMRFKRIDRREEIANIFYVFKTNRMYVDKFEEIDKLWYEYFSFTIRELGVNTKKAIDALYYDWDMDNWEAMHFSKSEYKSYNRDEVYTAFYGDADYISDRISFDRLFRIHWFFKKCFHDEILCQRYEWYKEDLDEKIISPFWNEDGTKFVRY